MCTQAVSLVAAELERAGIATVVIALLRAAALAVRPPRALLVPFRFGFPLDRPNAPEPQRRVLAAALAQLERGDLTPPALVDYAPPPAGAG